MAQKLIVSLFVISLIGCSRGTPPGPSPVGEVSTPEPVIDTRAVEFQRLKERVSKEKWCTPEGDGVIELSVADFSPEGATFKRAKIETEHQREYLDRDSSIRYPLPDLRIDFNPDFNKVLRIEPFTNGTDWRNAENLPKALQVNKHPEDQLVLTKFHSGASKTQIAYPCAVHDGSFQSQQIQSTAEAYEFRQRLLAPKKNGELVPPPSLPKSFSFNFKQVEPNLEDLTGRFWCSHSKGKLHIEVLKLFNNGIAQNVVAWPSGVRTQIEAGGAEVWWLNQNKKIILQLMETKFWTDSNGMQKMLEAEGTGKVWMDCSTIWRLFEKDFKSPTIGQEALFFALFLNTGREAAGDGWEIQINEKEIYLRTTLGHLKKVEAPALQSCEVNLIGKLQVNPGYQASLLPELKAYVAVSSLQSADPDAIECAKMVRKIEQGLKGNLIPLNYDFPSDGPARITGFGR